jgi:L-lactate dehydrogenase (cytochrome)
MAGKLDYADVALHNTKEDAWVVVDNTVYDLTNFAASHPGGSKYIHKYAGKVATEEFLAK